MLTNDLKHIVLMNPVRADHHIMGKDRTEQFWNHNANQALDSDMFDGRRREIWDGISFTVPQVKSKLAKAVINTYANMRLLLEPKNNVIDTFKAVKNSLNKMESMTQEDFAEYQNFIQENYSEFQRFALAGSPSYAQMQKKEISAGELYEYLTEAQMVEFIKHSERGLAMIDLYFFDRTIPASVSAKIKDAIELQVFDNIYILCYTPVKNPFFVNVVKEQEKKRDPIAFGVIVGSDKLFFIDDWEDEFCNLRFSDIKKFLAEKKCE